MHFESRSTPIIAPFAQEKSVEKLSFVFDVRPKDFLEKRLRSCACGKFLIRTSQNLSHGSFKRSRPLCFGS